MGQVFSFRTGEADRRTLERMRKVASESERCYENTIVKKPWGYEYLAFDNGQTAIWVLHIARKRKTSMHCHPNKTTGLLVLSGSVVCSSLDKQVSLESYDGVMVEKGCFHSTEVTSSINFCPPSENGAWIMEIEAPSCKSDLIRLDDAYGRVNKGYENDNSTVKYNYPGLLKITLPEMGETLHIELLDSVFTVRNAHYSDLAKETDDALIIPIACLSVANASSLHVGQLYQTDDLKQWALQDLNHYVFLTIERNLKYMKLTDYVASFIADLGVKSVFSVCGGGAMHLVDSFGRHEKLEYIPTHHEQAAAMAAEAYARIVGIGAALFTTGPGGTNALTGVAGAWIDSIPVVYISGQVTRDTLSHGTGLRQFGIQETDIVELVKPIVKYAVTVTDERDIRYEMEKAAYIALNGRPGPVWIDIPLDVQSKEIALADLRAFFPSKPVDKSRNRLLEGQVKLVLELLQGAHRPVLISGYGVHLAKAEKTFHALVERLAVPVVSSWTSSDLLASDHLDYVGRSGIFGDRASNFALQNADFLLIMGSRMSIPQVGYNYKLFAREARIIMVDIDPIEIRKPSLHVDIGIVADVGIFMREILQQLEEKSLTYSCSEWRERCRNWKHKYPVALPEYVEQKDFVNSFYFIDYLSKLLDEKAVVVTDMGTSFTCTMQTFQVKQGQRLMTSSGHASMGFGLPGAIGACFANKRRKTICISGEGGLQMNIQELQTIVHNRLPILIFILNNQGYLTIKHMQQNHFGRYVGSESGSGLSCPDTLKIAQAYCIPSIRIQNHDELHHELSGVLSQEGPFICEIMMNGDQPLIPRSSSLKRPDGSIVSKPLEDLYPFLDRQEFNENMIVKPAEALG